MPIGRSTNVAIHIPTNGCITSSFTSLLPKLFNRKKITKNITAKISGRPIPPLRIIEPNGAPIRKRTRQAMDIVIFSCHFIRCMRRFFRSLSKLMAELSVLDLILLIMVYVLCNKGGRVESGSTCLMESTLERDGRVFQGLSRYFKIGMFGFNRFLDCFW